MKLATIEIENYRAIEHLELKPDPSLTVLFGTNGCGKTSVLSPKEERRLAPFFTTSRSYFGRVGECVLAESPQEWV